MASDQVLISGYKIPSIGLGTAGIKGEEGKVAFNAALENGYRHFDTAYIYGNEKELGEVLKEWFSEGKLKRNDVFITTKLPGHAAHPDLVESSLADSLTALQLEYVDLYLIHHPVYRKIDEATGDMISAEADLVGVWKKMEEQVQAGRVKTIGVSNFSKEQIQKIWDTDTIKPACLQVKIHPYYQQPELCDFCKEKNIVVVAYSSLRSRGPPGPPGQNTQTSFLEDEVIKSIAQKHSKTPAQVILRYFLQNNVVTIPKSSTPSRQKENIELYDFSLDENDIQRIKSLDKGEAGNPPGMLGMGRGGMVRRGGMSRGGLAPRGGMGLRS